MINEKRVGDLIKYIDERNIKREITDFYGINIQKEFMPTLANTDGIDPQKYKIVRKNRFVFSGMQTGRDKCIRIGLYQNEKEIIVSPAYTTFEILDSEEILPEYFFMNFLSDEMDRYGWFISDSSVRSNLDQDRFEDIIIKVPEMEIQKKYVKIYIAIKRIGELNKNIKKICPVLIKASLEEAKGN